MAVWQSTRNLLYQPFQSSLDELDVLLTPLLWLYVHIAFSAVVRSKGVPCSEIKSASDGSPPRYIRYSSNIPASCFVSLYQLYLKSLKRFFYRNYPARIRPENTFFHRKGLLFFLQRIPFCLFFGSPFLKRKTPKNHTFYRTTPSVPCHRRGLNPHSVSRKGF